MNYIIKEWLTDLYKNEINNARGTIANERMWANGAYIDEIIQASCDNIALQEEYIKVLEEKLAELQE